MFLIIALILVTFIAFIYLKAYNHTFYWQKRGIDGPKSLPFTGNMSHWHGKSEWTKKFGKVYGIQEGWDNILVVSDVDMLHELFVKKFEYFHGRKSAAIAGNVDTDPHIQVFDARGERWKRLRAISNPIFSVSNIKKILPIMDDSVRVMLKFLDEAYAKNSNKPFNIHLYFHELTMDIISRICFGQQGTQQFCNKYTPIVREIFRVMNTNFFIYTTTKYPKLVPVLRFIADNTGRLRKDPFTNIIESIAGVVQERKKLRKNGEHKDSLDNVDFIDLFLEAESNEVTYNDFREKIFVPSENKIDKKLTTTEITMQLFVFLLAGYDTTANTLGLTCYNLVNNLEAQQQLQNEIDEICGNDESPTYEELNALKYADAVLKETLRLCPIGAL